MRKEEKLNPILPTDYRDDIAAPGSKWLSRKPKTGKKVEQDRYGREFENKIAETLREEFGSNNVITDAYFLYGNFIESLKIYPSAQIDAITALPCGLLIPEIKFISNSNKTVEGSTRAKKWTITDYNGHKHRPTNGYVQNLTHTKLIKEILELEGVDCPVFPITVIGGIEPSKIKADSNYALGMIVPECSLMDRINEIMHLPYEDDIDTTGAMEAIKKYLCPLPHRGTLQLTYCKKGLTKKKRKRRNKS